MSREVALCGPVEIATGRAPGVEKLDTVSGWASSVVSTSAVHEQIKYVSQVSRRIECCTQMLQRRFRNAKSMISQVQPCLNCTSSRTIDARCAMPCQSRDRQSRAGVR